MGWSCLSVCRLSVELPSLWAGPVCQCVACLNWLEQWFERVRGGRVGGGGGVEVKVP